MSKSKLPASSNGPASLPQAIANIYPRERLLPNIERIFTLDGPNQYGDIEDFTDLSKPIARGAIPDQRLGGWRETLPDGTRIEIRFPYMGVNELRMLNTLFLIASSGVPIRQGSIERLRSSLTANESRSLLEKLDIHPGDDVLMVSRQVMTLQFSERAIIGMMGLKSNNSDTRGRMLRALNMLAMTRIRVLIPPTKEEIKRDRFASSKAIGMSIISDYELSNGKVNLSVSPYLMRAIDRNPGTYSLYSLHESLEVKGDAGLLLHSWLSSFISPGEMRTVLMTTLAARLWVSYKKPTAAAKPPQEGEARKGGRHRSQDGLSTEQRKVVRKAMAALRDLGWDVSEKSGRFTVSRPKIQMREVPAAPALPI